MDYPDHERISRDILLRDHLTAAERDVLEEYLSQPASEWEREVDRESSTKVLLNNEMEELGICSLAEAERAERGYATELVQRVNSILQNHNA